MQLFTHIKRSIYDPSFYEELGSKPLSFSLKYIFSFAAIFGVLIMVQFAIFTLPDFYSGLKKAGPFVADAYPADLVLTLSDGKLSTNMEEPYVLPGVDEFATEMWEGEEDVPKHIVVIDTQVSPSIEYLEQYDTFVLVTQEHIMYQDEGGKITVQTFKDVPDGVLDKATFDQFVYAYEPYVYLLIPLAFLGLFIFAFLYVGFHLIYLFLAALFIILVAKARKKPMRYTQAYQAGIHLLTLPLVFEWFSPVSFPLMFTLMLLVLAMINFEQKHPEVTQQ